MAYDHSAGGAGKVYIARTTDGRGCPCVKIGMTRRGEEEIRMHEHDHGRAGSRVRLAVVYEVKDPFFVEQEAHRLLAQWGTLGWSVELFSVSVREAAKAVREAIKNSGESVSSGGRRFTRAGW